MESMTNNGSNIVTKRQQKNLSLVDWFILIAGFAAGFAWYRSVRFSQSMYLWSGSKDAEISHMIRNRLACLTVILIACTVSSLIVRLRKPPSPWRRIADLPGSAATIAASGVILLETVWMLCFGMGKEAQHYTHPLAWAFVINPGLAVFGAWTTLCLSGRWKFEKTAIDCWGCALGLIWFGMLVFYWRHFGLLR